MKDKKWYQEIRRVATEALDAIEDEERREQNRELVGKYYMYDNSYGRSDNDSWVGYCTVLRMDADGELYIMRFETDCEGKITIEPEANIYHSQLESYTLITEAAFEDAWDILCKRIAGLRLRTRG